MRGDGGIDNEGEDNLGDAPERWLQEEEEEESFIVDLISGELLCDCTENLLAALLPAGLQLGGGGVGAVTVETERV
jgi:hypothetical protein